MTDRYAVFGNPIAQSQSPPIHEAFAKASGTTIVYTRELAPVDGFRDAIMAFRASGGRGANVTAPFKIDAFALATHRSPRAQLAGAVNALKFIGDEIHADNFDGVGLVNDLQKNLNKPLVGKRVLLLGSGGAARGVITPILDAKPAELVIANRTLSKAAELAAAFMSFGNIVSADPEKIAQPFDVILNATSASLTDGCPTFSQQSIGAGTLAYELAYGKGLTPFLRFAKENGATQLADGLGMLVEQAALAFEWWHGKRPQTRAVIEAMHRPLEDRATAR
jgi:shikimate dehydrogenase